MPDGETTNAVIGELMPDRDKPAVYAWLRSFLCDHLEIWARAAGLSWGTREIHEHIASHGLVERDWTELVAASQNHNEYVGVARALGRAVGLIHINQHLDRYLQMSLGVVSWIFVEPVSRGTGVSKLLMDAGRAWMEERGLRAAEVFVTADNVAARKIYERGGFHTVDHRMLARLGRRR